jgi:hypothetical protein
MTVFKKKCSTRDPRFRNRSISFVSTDTFESIHIEDTEIICNGCNDNIYSDKEETFGYLIYLGKRELKADTPYDFYCTECTKRIWSDAVEVT